MPFRVSFSLHKNVETSMVSRECLQESLDKLNFERGNSVERINYVNDAIDFLIIDFMKSVTLS